MLTCSQVGSKSISLEKNLIIKRRIFPSRAASERKDGFYLSVFHFTKSAIQNSFQSPGGQWGNTPTFFCKLEKWADITPSRILHCLSRALLNSQQMPATVSGNFPSR